MKEKGLALLFREINLKTKLNNKEKVEIKKKELVYKF